jgi:hypothetical protein
LGINEKFKLVLLAIGLFLFPSLENALLRNKKSPTLCVELFIVEPERLLSVILEFVFGNQ